MFSEEDIMKAGALKEKCGNYVKKRLDDYNNWDKAQELVDEFIFLKLAQLENEIIKLKEKG